ncbi:MAG: hypothetical protein WCS89_03130 [Candidatus Paceibacterota bacterium]
MSLSCTCRVPVGVNGKKVMFSIDGRHGTRVQKFLRDGGSFSNEESLKKFVDNETDGRVARGFFTSRSMQRMSTGVT